MKLASQRLAVCHTTLPRRGVMQRRALMVKGSQAAAHPDTAAWRVGLPLASTLPAYQRSAVRRPSAAARHARLAERMDSRSPKRWHQGCIRMQIDLRINPTVQTDASAGFGRRSHAESSAMAGRRAHTK